MALANSFLHMTNSSSTIPVAIKSPIPKPEWLESANRHKVVDAHDFNADTYKNKKAQLTQREVRDSLGI